MKENTSKRVKVDKQPKLVQERESII